MEKVERNLINSVVFLCLILSISTFVITFLNIPLKTGETLDHLTAISHFCQRFLAFMLLLVVWNLHKRKYTAWLLTVVALIVNSLLYVIHQQLYGYIGAALQIVMALQIYCLIVLLGFHKYFRRPAYKRSLKKVVGFSAAILLFLLLNAAYEYFFLFADNDAHPTAFESLQDIFQYLFITGGTNPYSKFIFTFIWISAGICAVFILRPIVYRTILLQQDVKKARPLVLKYGQNPASYLALEADKNLFFGEEADGVIAYGVVDNCIVVQGDPICADEDFMRLLSEFDAYCHENDYHCLFLSATDKFFSEYAKLGYDHVKCGEEARIKLDEYQLAGGKMAKLRALINHAVKAGVTVREYKPLEKKDMEIERAINKVTDDWMAGKRSGKLVFSVGDVNLDNPLDRRYFYATDGNGKIVAFNVFLPFDGMKGYMADVTRRTHDAPGGATEKITYDAFMRFKEEGAVWGSMGVSPLANVEDGESASPVVSKILELAYEKGSRFYGFKSLHQTKERYTPTEWLPTYFVYSPKAINLDMAIAIIQLQNSGGIGDFIASLFKKHQG